MVNVQSKRPRVRRLAMAVAIVALFLVSSLAATRFVEGQTSDQITQTWAQQMAAQWQPEVYHNMSFGALITSASYDQIEYSYNTPAVLQGYLNLMESSGAGYIRIDVGYDAWLHDNLTVQKELQSMVSQMRSDGKGFILADAGAEAYRSNPLPWAQFQQAWIQRVTTLAAFFHPNYYIVIKEPGWYVPMISDATTNPLVQSPAQWLNLTQYLTNAVLSVSPTTKVGVAIAADGLNQQPSFYTAYLNGLPSIKGLSFMGFDIYTTSGFASTESYLSQYGHGNLSLWMAECWSGSNPSVVYDSSRSTLDPIWMKAAYYFAQKEGFSMMVPFFTNLFASYSLTSTSPSTSSQIISLQQQRTPVFYMYQNVTSGLENIPSSATTTSTIYSSSTTPTHTTTSTTSSHSTTVTPPAHTSTLLIIAAAVVIMVVVAVGYALTRKRK